MQKNPDWKRLAPLVADLDGRVQHPGLDVRARSIELGKFLEDVRLALATLLGDAKQQDLLALKRPLAAVAPYAHEHLLHTLTTIYKRRCLAAHANLQCPDPAGIPLDLRSLGDALEELCGHLHRVRDAQDRGFVELLYEVQVSSQAIKRADLLADALLRALHPDIALAIVHVEALERQLPLLPGTQGEDDAARARTMLRELARRTAAGAADALTSVATTALGVLAPEDHGDVLAWLALDSVLRPPAQSARMHVLAVYLRALADSAYEIWGWNLVQPAVPGLNRAAGVPLPVTIPKMEALFEGIARITRAIGATLEHWPSGKVEIDWARVTLVFHVEHGLAGHPFESAPDRFRTLGSAFRAVAVRPLRQTALGTTRNAPEIDPPDGHRPNSVRFDRPMDLNQVHQRARHKAAAFHGPWAAPLNAPGPLAAVEVFDGHPCAVVARDLSLEQALSALFPADADRATGALFERITQLRESNRVLLLWADPEYTPVDPTCL